MAQHGQRGELPDPLHAVLSKDRIRGDHRQFFLERLRNQQAVKRVAMMLSERFDSPDMRDR